MKNRVSKVGRRRPSLKVSKCSQEQLLSAVTRESADHPPNRSLQFPAKASLSTPAKSTKRQLELEEIDQPARKRSRLSTGEGQDLESADKKTTTIQQPKPRPPHATFLKNLAEPFQPDPRPNSVTSFVSEWLESFDSDRNTRCRSDTCLSLSVSEPVSRQLTRSAPQMGHSRDADGFAVPPMPASTGSRSRAGTDIASVAPSDATSRASGRSLVEDPRYRDMNLAANNIYIRSSREQFPESITDLIRHVRRDRDSPEPSTDQIWQDGALEELSMGVGESEVEKYFHAHIFPDPKPLDSLKRADRQPMARHTVPNTGSKLKVSNPVPDMLYGYNRHNAFPQQQTQLISMGTEMVVNNQYNGLLYPFFVVEFKGDSGSMWAATNQCLGGSASCVNVAERLNRQLEQCKNDEVHLINSATFSIAMSGSEARLYISWKDDELRYNMANVESFLLQRPDHYLEFRKYVRNIIDWGKDKRLAEIQSSLNTLLEESRKRASEAAKSRPPPSASPVTSSKRGKSSSRGRSSGRASDVSQSSVATKSYWSWDATYSRWFHVNVDGSIVWAEEESEPSAVPA